MQDILNAVKDVFATFTSLGWLPMPLAVATVAMFALRIAFEPDVLAVSTKEDIARLGRVKLGIFFGVSFVTALIQYGLQKPANGFDRALAIGFTLSDVMFAYVITSSQKFKGFVKSQFAKGSEAVPDPPKP